MTKDDEPIRRGDVRHEIQSWWDNANDGREPSDIIAAIPAVKPVVKPLERAKGQDKSAGWTLPMELLCSIKDEIRPSGYGGAVCLEEVEMIALAVEARILAALAAQPAPEVAALVGALRIIDAFNPERHINELSADAARGLVLRMGELARATLAATKKPLSMT